MNTLGIHRAPFHRAEFDCRRIPAGREIGFDGGEKAAEKSGQTNGMVLSRQSCHVCVRNVSAAESSAAPVQLNFSHAR